MYLTRIEMNGFKSFNTKKELVIKKGITGVVGPNGSGKSNIADAIRWVLGEQSSKNLRGARMEDVIFNGTLEYGKKGYCEVELGFDNSDHKFSSEYDEISVRRKMYRSGESEYYINGTLCRLKDVIELFRDTGIGKEGYSIIGQGRIDEILNSKPSSRRRVFEEAAGIMKYRAKKEEAERNLEKTRGNLLRLEDIICELEMQLEPLSVQMEAAKQFLGLRDRLKILEVNLYLHNHDRIMERLKKINIQQNDNAEEIKDTENNLEKLLKDIGSAKSKLDEIQNELDLSNTELAEFSSKQERLRGEYNLVLEKEKNTEEQKKLLEKSVDDNSIIVADSKKSLDTVLAEMEQLNGKIDLCSEKLEALRKDKEDKSVVADACNEALTRLRTDHEQARDALEGVRLEISECSVKIDVAMQHIDSVMVSDEQIRQQGRELKADIDRLSSAVDDVFNKKSDCLKKANEIALKKAELNKKYDTDIVSLNELKNELSQKYASKKLLSGLKDSYEGYASGVKGLLSAKSDNTAIRKSLIGTVADIISVPKKFELAVETLLGNTLQNVVVKKETDAKAAIEYLRRGSLGRVTFLPLEALQVRYLTDEEKNSFGPRVLGIASELVNCSETVRAAIDFLLARTVITEDIDSAFDLMKKNNYGFRVVTLKGDILRPGGSVTGGSADKQNHGFLMRNRMISELECEITDGEKEAEELAHICDDEKRELDLLESQHAACIDDIRSIDIRYTELNSNLKNANDRYSAIAEETEQAEQRLNNAQKELAGHQTRMSVLEMQFEDNQQRFSETARELEKCEADVKENSRDIAEILLAMQKEELDKKDSIGRKEKMLLQCEHIRAEIHRCEKEINAARQRIDAFDTEIEENIEKTRREILSDLDDITLTLKNTSVKVQDIFRKKESLLAEIAEKEKEHTALSDRQGEIIEQKYRLAAQVEKTQMQQENAENRIWEDYSLTYANALEYRIGSFSYQSGIKEVENIKELLRGMGAVNPNAIEDFARVNERMQELLLQKSDLEKAGEDLKAVISSLLTDMTGCFKEKFSMINARFGAVFQTLFGGGKAELVLLDSEDIMECGIDIIAEPPGKKLQNLSLLSGGEKALCAISLLFAMLDINPSPVCLLDEIDAPLDDANLYRFSDYLKMLSRDLQFIVITHRKPTMSVCDTLYGVAMQKKGISEILSVDLG